jgi:hypothetical protein
LSSISLTSLWLAANCPIGSRSSCCLELPNRHNSRHESSFDVDRQLRAGGSQDTENHLSSTIDVVHSEVILLEKRPSATVLICKLQTVTHKTYENRIRP